MPWHLSKSDPRKVYDERHEVVCVCQSAEQAAHIVAAVTGKPQEPQQIKLREHDTSKLVHTAQVDGCCGRAIHKASLAGTLDSLKPFECPKCGTVYEASAVGPVINWQARADVLVWKP